MKRALFVAGMLVLAATLAVPFSNRLEAQPVPLGIAFDSVLKFAQGTDAAGFQPGNFDGDFQTASQPASATPPRGGVFARITSAMDQAGAMMAAFKNGMAERHYIAGNRERTDYPATQKATILDCGARTITSLDLKAKTYTVVSLDAPRTPSGSGGGTSQRGTPGAMPTDDGTRVSMTLVNKALGPRTIGPDVTDGFSSDMTVVTTRPSGESTTSTMNLNEYLSKTPRLSLVCNSAGANAAVPAMASMGMAQYRMMQSALYGSDPRITVSASGPALPARRLAVFEVTTMSGGQTGQARGGFAILTERGNIRSIRANDPIFSVPSDFTLTS